MKIGDYVRTKSGYISKYIGKNKTPYVEGKHLSFETTIRDIRFEETDEDTMIWESELEKGLEEIIKSSPNIIDLIEVGDYVNGYKVLNVYYDEVIESIRVGIDYQIIKDYTNQDIKSIVTHEQFLQMEYKL